MAWEELGESADFPIMGSHDGLDERRDLVDGMQRLCGSWQALEVKIGSNQGIVLSISRHIGRGCALRYSFNARANLIMVGCDVCENRHLF